jgi:hypothetical protein
MNRAERRRQERAGVSIGKTMSQYREEAYSQGYRDGMAHEIEVTFNMLAYTLTYKTGYSKAKIQELLRTAYLHIDSFRTNQLTPDDYDTICKELEGKGISLSAIMKTIN